MIDGMDGIPDLTPNLSREYFLKEAKTRWLRPSEIIEILHNHQRFTLIQDPSNKPPSGSLFLIDRKLHRYFRKDGHCWRKKSGGGVQEANEKLKVGNVDVVRCCYVRGEDNSAFQRRIYWALDESRVHTHTYEGGMAAWVSLGGDLPDLSVDFMDWHRQVKNIALVHYRDLNEESRIWSETDPSTFTQASYVSTPTTFACHGQSLSEFEDADSVDKVYGDSPADSRSFPRHSANERIENNIAGYCGSIPHPHPDGLIDAASLIPLCNSFSPYQADLENLLLSEDRQPMNRASQTLGSVDGSCFRSNSSLPMLTVPNTKSFDDHEQIISYGQLGCFNSLTTQKTDTLSNGYAGTILGSVDGSCFMSNTSLPMVTESNKKSFDDHEQNIPYGQLDCFDSLTRPEADTLSNGCTDAIFGVRYEYTLLNANPQSFMADEEENFQVERENAATSNNFAGTKIMNDSNHAYEVSHEHHLDAPHFHYECMSRLNSTTDQPLYHETEFLYDPTHNLESDIHPSKYGELNKLDSFGRWMNKEMGKDCDKILMSSVSGSYWNDLETQSGDEEVSNLSHHVHLDIPLGPSVSQEQLFSILEFSPEWIYSGVERKVLISGKFLGGIEPTSCKWCCMFGEYEVAAEVLTANVIRCQAPAHAPGRVPFYITCSNRTACSEVREFEYRENLHSEAAALKSIAEQEIYFQVRFAKLLSLGMDRKGPPCSSSSCPKCHLNQNLYALLIDNEFKWEKIEKDSRALQGSPRIYKQALIESMLKEKLFEWLVCRTHEGGKQPEAWDEEGLRVIHLASALGYQWALRPIVTAGISPSFRDSHGRTGLHWAAYYGREAAVISLVKLDADPGAVEDPTLEFPEGRTAADLAWMRGHKGISGYLAELDLTRHVSKLAIKETVGETVSMENAAKRATETVLGQISFADDKGEKVLLQQSLVAVRNSALAAARIQSALGSKLNCERRSKRRNTGNAYIPDEVLLVSSLNNKNHRLNHFNDYLHTAAIGKQKNHGVRVHKDFLKIHHRFKKIQARVGGHQVPMHYKKILWSVSVIEKAILRWRRKRSGLRGVQVKDATGVCELEEAERTNEYQFLHLGRQQKMAATVKALERVQSMARNRDARLQYTSLVANFHKLKLGEEQDLSGSLPNLTRGKEG